MAERSPARGERPPPPTAERSTPQTGEAALVGLGSNVAPERHLPAALRALRARVDVERASSAWATPAVGPAGQPPFLNAAVIVRAGMSPERLRTEVLHAIERELGRVRTTDRFAPRTIDLDLVMVGESRLRIGEREIPDPDLLAQAFLAVPAAEVAPRWRHPVTGERLAAIATRLVAALPAALRPRRVDLPL